MTIHVSGTTVEVLGKSYQIKCPDHEIDALQKAAEYLEEKMREIRQVNHVLSVDRIAVLAALNMTHQLLTVEHEKHAYKMMVDEKLAALQAKLDSALGLQATIID
jgi:cell division protein ZapA